MVVNEDMLIIVVRKVTIYIMTFLKRFFLVLFARGCGGLCGVIGGCSLLGERGLIGCRGWRTLVFDGVRFLGFFCVFGETRLLGFEKY